MIISWTQDAWSDYLFWQNQGNKKTVKRINKLVKDIARHPFDGIGKPEVLKSDLTGLWSRRIDAKDRLIYECQDKQIIIYSCKNHYGDH
jgi:toxin YoeB